MCVAVPGKVVWIGTPSDTSIPARLDLGDRQVEADLVMVPEAELGDFVIAHSGYAIRLVETAAAEELRSQLGIAN